MIEGLKLKLETKELQELLMSRVEHHRSRAAKKEAELPALRDAYDRIKAATPENIQQMAKMSNSYHASEDPVGDLEKDIKDHKNKAIMFEFFATHLFPAEVYQLAESDLVRLELVKRA